MRLYYLDEAKAIALFSVILGHMACPEIVRDYIYTFHVPLFFIISGFCFKKRSLKEEIAKIIKTLIIPYYIFSLLSLLYAWYAPVRHPDIYYGVSGVNILTNGLLGIVRGENMITPYSYMPYPPLWFLISLAIVRFYHQLFFKYMGTNVGGAIIIVLSFILSYISNYFDINYFSIRPAMVCIPFFLIGFSLKKMNLNLNNKYLPLQYVFLSATFVASFMNGKVDINSLAFGKNLLLFYLFAINNSLLVIYIFKNTRQISVLEKIGKNTLCVLGLSGIIGFVVTLLYMVIFGKEILDTSFYYLPASVIITYSGYRIGVVIVQRFPFVVGKF